jgi:carboxyl-terminal processing protease
VPYPILVRLLQGGLYSYDQKIHTHFTKVIEFNAMDTIKNRKVIITFIVLETLLLLTAFGVGYFVRDWVPSPTGNFSVLGEAFKILEDNGLKDLPPMKTLEYGMIRGMIEAYDDPYTTFVEAPQHELQTNQLQGNFGGIGARLEKDTSGNIFLFPIPESPSAKAGIRDGDLLISVEDLQITQSTSMEDIQAAIRGPVNKRVLIVVSRAPDHTPIDVSIKRQEVSLPSTTWNVAAENQQFGLIQINIVAASTPSEVEKAINDLKDRGVSYFILDLRDNRGGLVDAGLETASLFLTDGILMHEQYRDQPVKTFDVDNVGKFSEIPLAVIVNQNTASAAEIIAGVLKSHDRAILVGHETYGKDSIQLIYDLVDGSSLHVTAARWWIPELNFPLGDHGLHPDVAIQKEDSHDPIVIKSAIDSFSTD